jgi:hypothetical protein
LRGEDRGEGEYPLSSDIGKRFMSNSLPYREATLRVASISPPTWGGEQREKVSHRERETKRRIVS